MRPKSPGPKARTATPKERAPKNAERAQEGAGNNDERELPERLRVTEGDKAKNRPPTNNAPDRERDPAQPTYLEVHPKDRPVNN